MAERHRALVTAPMRGEGLATLSGLADLVVDPWIDHQPIRIYSAEQLAARARAEGADLIVCESDRCDGPVLELPLVAIASTRGDPTNVDVPGATAAGIPVLRAPGRNADGVAELTVALLFAVNNRLLLADRETRAGQAFKDGTIPYQRHRRWELAGRTAGLVGLGAVGRAVKWRLEGLGMRVLAHDPYVAEGVVPLPDLLARSDVVSVHAPPTPETQGMIGAEEIAAMRDGVIFVNTARASVHDTDALVSALRSGKVAGAGLDHFEGEVLATDHPLALMDNVVLTPHIGGATFDTEERHARLVADGLVELLAGRRPANIVNPEVLSF